MGKAVFKILVAVSGYYPGANLGGIATSRENFALSLRSECDVKIVTLNHDYKNTEPYPGINAGWIHRQECEVLYIEDTQLTGEYFDELLKEMKPDLLYASGTITSYFAFNRHLFGSARKLGIPIVVTPDGDLAAEALSIKPLKKRVAIGLCGAMGAFRDVYFQATSEVEYKRILDVLGPPKGSVWLLPMFPSRINFRQGYIKCENTLRIVFCARIARIKNLDFLLETLACCDFPLVLDIFGPLEDRAYWKECIEMIEVLPDCVSVKYRGQLDSRKAKRIYESYDAFVLPTKSENYCFAIEEALLCGCPVVTTKGVTPWDDIDGKAGYVVPLESDSYLAVLRKMAAMDSSNYSGFESGLRDYVCEKFDVEKLVQAYLRMFRAISGGQNG